MMNEVIKAMHERRSVKKYKAEMPPKELISQVVDAGLWAASGMGQQNTKLIVVKNHDLRNRISELNRLIGGWKEGLDPFYGAPVIIVVLDRKDTTTTKNDGSLVMGNMMLAAHSLGLGSCWINRAKEVFELEEGRKILEEIGINADNWVGVGNLALGYPDGDAPKAHARKVNRIVTME